MKIIPASSLRTQDRIMCAGLIYRIVEVSRDEIVALREDDTGSLTLRIHDDAPVTVLGVFHTNNNQG